MCGRLGLDVLAAPVCCSITERKRQRNRRAKISTRAADPAMGWTSPLPAVRMRAAMLESAVVATCRGRRRRGAIREDVLLTSRTDDVGFSCDRNQPDCLKSDASCSAAPMHAQYMADAFVGPQASRLAR